MFVVFSDLIVGRKIEQPMFVNKDAFKETETEFKSTLKDHEYLHASDLFNGIPCGDGILTHEILSLLRTDITTAILDLRAFYHQMKKMKEGNITEDGIQELRKCYLFYYQMLENSKPEDMVGIYIRKNQLEFFGKKLEEFSLQNQ
jgi:hypothetical protein